MTHTDLIARLRKLNIAVADEAADANAAQVCLLCGDVLI